jgi:hypothetical protein
LGTVVEGDFEWDAAKAASNVAKHGVSFEEAATALVDPDATFLQDQLDPDRLIAIGMSANARVLVVVHVERGARDRIISARPATRTEQAAYPPR